MTNRITHRTVTTSVLDNLQSNLARLQRLQDRLSSGRTINRPSDSPTGAVESMRLRADIRRAEQLVTNADDGLAWLGTADAALTDLLGVVRRAKELALGGANASASDSDRAAMAAEARQLRQHALSLANTAILGRPVFAGTAGVASAYDANGAYVGNAGVVARTVAPDVEVQVNVAGPDAFGSPGADVFDVLGDVGDHLVADPSQLTTTDIDRLDAAFRRVQDALSVVGARYRQVETMKAQTTSARLDRTSALAEIEGVDLPATITELKLQEVAYQAALGASARSLQPSLADFLR